MFNQYFADLHIHVGMSESGKWVKIPTSRKLTARGILSEATDRKGMNIIGIVDALSPLVLTDIRKMTEEGLLVPVANGGYLYQEKTLLILGAEIETREPGGGLAHTLVFLPDLQAMAAFSAYMSQFIRNISLSSQNAHMPLQKLVTIAGGFDALIIPAHVFTPHKSVYGTCCTRLSEILSDQQLNRLAAIELGLSADSDLADRINELAAYTFVTNSDAHSLDKIAREYTVFSLQDLSFHEVAQALSRTAGRQVRANYGLNPQLGKYHRTFCPVCGFIDESGMTGTGCPECNSLNLITGVYDRIKQIADYPEPQHPLHRPDYFYQVPLEFIPGLGKKMKDRLLAEFKTEMAIIHSAGRNELNQIAGTKITDFIMQARAGTAVIAAGGGGIYGRLVKN